MKDNDNAELINKACWRKNGVWGTELPRCEKLRYVRHCRNCDVFEQAALQAFSVNQHSNNNMDIGGADAPQGDTAVLPFRIASYCFAIPINSVVTISDQVAIHSIPFNRNPVIKGMIAINHEVYPFMSLSDLLSLELLLDAQQIRMLRGLYKRILVINLGGRCVAFYVDEVYPIYHYLKSSVQVPKGKNMFEKQTDGYLFNNQNWCSDCYLLSLDQFSDELEHTFL